LSSHYISANPTNRSEDSWNVVGALPGQDACQTAANQFNEGKVKKGQDASGLEYTYGVVCLPDTVDRRGPKAK
jgi:hypothetical protein